MLQPDKKSSKDIEKPYLRAANLSWEGALLEDVKSMWFSPEELEKFKLQKGDVLISEGGDVGRSCYWDSDLELYIQNAMTRARSKSKIQFSKYLYYWVYHLKNIGQIDSICNAATIAHFTADKVKETLLLEPPIDEQYRIATFLDQKTAEIDEAITKKQRLVELLKEQKAILINQAVTKGLNPNVPMRDSGVEWIGEVPAHWETITVKRLAKPGYKTFTDGDWIESPFITDCGVRLVQTGNVGIGEYREKGFRHVSEDTFHKLRCTEVDPSDILICRLDGPVGRACLAPELGVRMITSVDNAILKTGPEFDSRFVVYFMSSDLWLNWIQALCRVGGGFRFRISRTMLGDLKIIAPPLRDQRKIADKLEDELQHISSLALKLAESMKSLNSYRLTLISNVVTGKIKV